MKLNELITALKIVSRALISTDHPLLVQLVVTRRCNLSCAYCNEYDKASDSVPLEELKKRIKALANLKTEAVTCTGGEPLLHPNIDAVIREIRSYGMVATIITNGYLLTVDRIHELNDAGLQYLQISIDNIEPDKVSYKSLKVLERKLQLLADHAKFNVNINSVLGVSDERTLDAIVIARRAADFRFSHSVGVLHDGKGLLKPLSDKQRQAYAEIGGISKSLAHFLNYHMFQKKLMEGKPNNWKCRAGARYLYICEDGLVHWRSQQRGYPGIPLAEYTVEDIQREFRTQKNCGPFCTVACVHQMSLLDEWRSVQPLPDPQTAPLLKIQVGSGE